MFKLYNNLDAIGTSSAMGGPLWPWFDSTYINSTTIPPYLSLGALFNISGEVGAAGGNTFMCVKSLATLATGTVVSMAVPTVTDIVAGAVVTSGTTTQTIKTNMTTTASEIGNLLYIANSADATLGFVVRPILGQLDATLATQNYTGVNTAFVISTVDWTVASKPADANALVTAPVSPNPVYIYRPFNVGINVATTTPCGVSLGVVTAGNYTVIQVAGYGLALGIGSGTALAAGVPAVGGAGGALLGSTAGATPYMSGGSVTPLVAYAGAVSLQPFAFNFIGNC